MTVRFTFSIVYLLFSLGFVVSTGQAQDVTGLWIGVSYVNDPAQGLLNSRMNLIQSGSLLSGTSETALPNKSFDKFAYVSGQVNANKIQFTETDINGSTELKDYCFWNGNLLYNPVDESLIGTYEHITNGTCKKVENGKVELYRVVPKSPTIYCQGSPINIVITGKNIRWYDSPIRANPIAQGNTFSPSITKTTTFFVTQTLYNNESPAIPVKIEIVESSSALTATPTHPGCGQTSGSISLSATGSTDWLYSLNGGNYQSTSSFSGLSPGIYTINAKNGMGCTASQSVTLVTALSPVIDDLKATPPPCGGATGEVTVVASKGTSPFMYSIDYGTTFQSSPTFSKLTGGSYTLRVRDANRCEVNKAINLQTAGSISIISTAGVPTTCGKANGAVTLTTSGGSSPVQYSIDNQTFQATNSFTGLAAGNYTIQARDSKGCTVNQSVSVGASTGPQTADVQTTTEDCGLQNGAILIAPARTPGIIDYAIDGLTFLRTTAFAGLKAGTYTLTTKDINNCTVTQPVVVPLNCANRLYLPTAFSPNGDRMNDALTVHFAFSSLSIVRFTVYDRWGAILYNRANFALSNGEPVWDGQVNGQAASAGVYGYQLDAQFPDGTQVSRRESVTLLDK